MHLPAINLFSHDVAQVIWGQLDKIDLVKAARVCKVWQAAISGEKMESYWKEALQFIAKPIEERSSFQLFTKSLFQLFQLHKKGLSKLEVKVATIKEMEALRRKANSAPKQFQEENFKKDVVAREINKGLSAAITLYSADLLDFSVLENYIAKSSQFHDPTANIILVAKAEYQKVKKANYAKIWLAKNNSNDWKFKNQLEQLIVQECLAAKNLEGAIAIIKPQGYSITGWYPEYGNIAALIRTVAYAEKRLDIVEQLFDFIPRREWDKYGVELIQSHLEAGNQVEALRIKNKFQH